LLVAGVCLFADTLGFLSSAPISAAGPREWAALGAIVAADAALALPARFSGWVAAVHALVLVGATLLTASPGGAGHDVGGAGFLIAAYRAGAWLRGGPAWWALGALVLGTVGVSMLPGGSGDELLVVEVATNALLPWLVGRYTTARRGYIAELEQQAETERRNARAYVEEAVRHERSAIARDLHDVISHHVSAIGVHAGAARMRLVAARQPPDVTESLAAVETSSRAAMSDLRQLLDLLHGDSTHTDQFGLNDIEELLNGVRRAGLPTRFKSQGAVRPVPDSLQVALYRITQEMLTNAQRHGDGGTVEVVLHFSESTVSVTARNGMSPPPTGLVSDRDTSSSTSRGLAGISQRAALFGGTFVYGPEPDGDRWETAVVFPLPNTQ
jgi:signal transduction histidine kinase